MVPRHPNGADSDVQTLSVFGREPWSSGYGLLKGCGFKSQSRILDGHFFPLICSINCIVCLKSPKINKKEAGVGPIFKKNDGDVGLSIFSHLDWHFFIEINKNIISLA